MNICAHVNAIPLRSLGAADQTVCWCLDCGCLFPNPHPPIPEHAKDDMDGTDHDTLIEIKTIVTGIAKTQDDFIKETRGEQKDQNVRMTKVENEQARQGVYSGFIAVIVGGAISGVWHFFFPVK